MRYVQNDNLFDNNPLFDLGCDDFRSNMRAVDTKPETPKSGHRSAKQSFVHACGVFGAHAVVGYRYRRQLAFIFRSL